MPNGRRLGPWGMTGRREWLGNHGMGFFRLGVGIWSGQIAVFVMAFVLV